MVDYYIPAGRAFGNPGPGLPRQFKPGDPLPALTAPQIARLVRDGSLALRAPQPRSVVVPSPAPGYEIPSKFPASKHLPGFLDGYSDPAHVRALWRADGRSSADRHYRKRLKALE
jgi:hypothetical protein